VISEKKKMKELYGEDYWKNKNFENKYYVLATQICEFLHPENVLDYGCGKGFFVHSFNYLGVKCKGYDISDYVIKHPYGLAKEKLFKIVKKEKYDLVVCMDVLEHIPKKDEDDFIKKMLKHVNKYLLLSICDTTLKDIYVDKTHVNIKPRAYWEYKFSRLGLIKVKLPDDFAFRKQMYCFRQPCMVEINGEKEVIGL